MSKAIVDPDQLRTFAARLEQSRQKLTDQKIRVKGGFDQLHDTWRDEKYAQFERTFTESSKQLDLYILACEKYADFLKRKAALAQRYLENR